HWPPMADNLRQTGPPPLGSTRTLDAVGQPIGDPEPLLDRCQQQYSGVRGSRRRRTPPEPACPRPLESPAESPYDRAWRPRTPASVLRLPQQQNHTRIQPLVSRPPAPSTSPMNYPG